MPRRNSDDVFMIPEDFELYLEEVFGPTWKSEFAIFAGLSPSQINRYWNSVTPIPKSVACLVLALRQVVRLAQPIEQPQPLPKRAAAASAKTLRRARHSLRRRGSVMSGAIVLAISGCMHVFAHCPVNFFEMI